MFPAAITEIQNSDDQKFMMGLYANYRRLMYHLAKKWIDDVETQEDVVQDCLVKLIPKIPLLRQLDDARLAGYIASTVHNTSIKHLQQQARMKQMFVALSIEELSEDLTARTPTPEEMVIQDEQKKAFLKMWAGLPERDRLLLEGKYILGQSDRELAEWMVCQEASVRMALTRARRNVLNKLKGRENDDSSGIA